VANADAIAAVACNRDVTKAAPGPLQDCRDVVHISIFFDGTGNNLEADIATKSWSNVARMYEAAILDTKKSIFPIYVAGVGTAYNGKAVNWMKAIDVWREDHLGGLGFGGGGTRRLRQGHDEVNDRLRDVLIENARRLGAETAKYAANATSQSFAEVNDVLGKHRLIKIINMSFFGFSRGAALARAFSNRVIMRCKSENGQLAYAGNQMRFNFLGIFDTVASFGVPSKNVRLPFEERELVVSPRVERCVHYVAANEVRFAFPVDLIRKHGKLAGEWVEAVYPGVHSDVGGGYEPSSQAIDSNYARIPMRDMMRESVTSGVRMLSYHQIEKSRRGLFDERFKCHESTLLAYRNYVAVCGPMSGTVEAQIKRHMEVFYSANGTMHRMGIETPGERRRNEDKYKYLGPKGMAWEISKYRLAAKTGEWLRFGGIAISGYAQYIKPKDWQIAAWDRPAPPGAVAFVSRYVHDSKVDFIGNLIEPFSYFRPRGVQESTANITVEWGNWMSHKLDDAKHATSEAYESGKQTVSDAAEATAAAARETAEATRRKAEALAAAAKRKADDAALLARQKANEAASAAKRTYDATSQAASHAAAAAHRKAQEAAAYADRQADAAAAALKNAYDATTDAGKRTVAAGGRKIGEIRDDTEKLIDRGISWIKHTFDND
jgi:hypothetical protein